MNLAAKNSWFWDQGPNYIGNSPKWGTPKHIPQYSLIPIVGNPRKGTPYFLNLRAKQMAERQHPNPLEESQILSPKPEALTLNPKPETLNPKP